MEKNNLIGMWHQANAGMNWSKEMDIEKIIRREHCTIVSKVLHEQRLKIMAYLFVSIIFGALLIYAFVYLRLKLSVASVIPLSFAGMFLLIKTIFEWGWLRIMQNTKDSNSIKESTQLFYQKIKQIQKFDFLSLLIYCYGWVLGIVWALIRDFEGLGGLSSFVVLFILLLLAIPWFTNYLYSRKYKRLYATLNQSIHFLEEV